MEVCTTNLEGCSFLSCPTEKKKGKQEDDDDDEGSLAQKNKMKDDAAKVKAMQDKLKGKK